MTTHMQTETSRSFGARVRDAVAHLARGFRKKTGGQDGQRARQFEEVGFHYKSGAWDGTGPSNFARVDKELRQIVHGISVQFVGIDRAGRVGLRIDSDIYWAAPGVMFTFGSWADEVPWTGKVSLPAGNEKPPGKT